MERSNVGSLRSILDGFDIVIYFNHRYSIILSWENLNKIKVEMNSKYEKIILFFGYQDYFSYLSQLIL